MKRILVAAVAAFLLSAPGWAQKVAISNNLAADAFLGTLNIQGQYAVGQHWSVTADAVYNPFTLRKGTVGDEESMASQLQARQRSFAAGIRWWPWHIYSGWWIGAKGKWQEYNSNFWCVNDRILGRGLQTEEGNRIGVSVGAGYTLMLAPWFNIDFGVSGWGGRGTYTRYSCPLCGRVVENGSKTFLLPDELTIAAMFIF